MSRRLGLSLLAVGAVAVLVSTASASPHGESRRGGTLRIMWGGEPDSFDPALATGTLGSWLLLQTTCATLFTTVYDPDTGKSRVVPEVVESFTRSNGDRTYTFELKSTFRFHTGARVTARSFVDALNRDADPRMEWPVIRRGLLQDVVGAEAAMEGTAKGISGVQALGRYRLRIRLKRAAGDFVARLTMRYFCPILPGTPIDQGGIADPSGSRPYDPGHYPGSGPYYLADRIPGRRLVLERNPYYGGGRTANPDRIVWTIEPKWSERLRATVQGEADFTLLGFGPPDAVVRDLVDTFGVNRPGGQVFRSMRTSAGFYFRFNLDRPAFKGTGQAPLRKAINYALDRPRLARAHGYLDGRPSDRLLPAAFSNRRPFYPLDGPDLVAAQRWLALAKKPPQTLTLYTANFPFGIPSALEFESNLRQLGIEVEVRPFDYRTFVEKLATRGEPWDVALIYGAASGISYPDPAGFLIPFLRGTRYEARMNAAIRLTGSARAKAWAELEADLMRDDPPVAKYADFTPLWLVSQRFGCWVPYELDLAAPCKQ